MANKIQVRRGEKAQIPILSEGEFGFCTDAKEVHIGTNAGNLRVDAYAPHPHSPGQVVQDANNRFVTDTEKSTWNGKLAPTGNGSDLTNAFTQAATRANLSTGEKISVSLGKLMKWFADFGTFAFKSSAAKTDLDSALQTEITNKLDKTGNASDVTNTLTQATTRANLATGEKLSVSLGKLMKWFADFGTLAFKSSAAKTDLDSALQTEITNKLDKTGNASDVTNTLSQATTRENLATGEKLSVSLGKLMKWFVDLKAVAFSGSAGDLTGTNNAFNKSYFTGTPNGDGTGSASTGNADSIARGDHRHPLNVDDTSNPVASDGTTTSLPGTATAYARRDHKHPSDATKAPNSHVGAGGTAHSKANGTTAGFSDDNFTATEKSKLGGIASGANNYSHPAPTRTNSGSNGSTTAPGFGGTFTAVGDVSSNTDGHVTGATHKTITIPSTAASASASGLVNTGDQTFEGQKTFNRTMHLKPTTDDNYSQGIRMHRSNGGYSALMMGLGQGAASSGGATEAWFVGSLPAGSNYDFLIANNAAGQNDGLCIKRDGSDPLWKGKRIETYSEFTPYLCQESGWGYELSYAYRKGYWTQQGNIITVRFTMIFNKPASQEGFGWQPLYMALPKAHAFTTTQHFLSKVQYANLTDSAIPSNIPFNKGFFELDPLSTRNEKDRATFVFKNYYGGTKEVFTLNHFANNSSNHQFHGWLQYYS